ncbi:hypothetical protein BT69DRAFT_287534 [Atractiella rhizophila]|nr:hypothetical protein BT69DRAFT_287534 [Atractiella rhizophila]
MSDLSLQHKPYSQWPLTVSPSKTHQNEAPKSSTRVPLETKRQNTIPTPSPSPPSVSRQQYADYRPSLASRKSTNAIPTPPTSQGSASFELNTDTAKEFTARALNESHSEEQENRREEARKGSSVRSVKTARSKKSQSNSVSRLVAETSSKRTSSPRASNVTATVVSRDQLIERSRSASIAPPATSASRRSSSIKPEPSRTEKALSATTKKSTTRRAAGQKKLRDASKSRTRIVIESDGEDELLLRGGADKRASGEGKDWTKSLETRSMRSMSYISTGPFQYSGGRPQSSVPLSRHGSLAYNSPILPGRFPLESFAEQDDFDEGPSGSVSFEAKATSFRRQASATEQYFAPDFGPDSDDDFDCSPRARSPTVLKSPTPALPPEAPRATFSPSGQRAVQFQSQLLPSQLTSADGQPHHPSHQSGTKSQTPIGLQAPAHTPSSPDGLLSHAVTQRASSSNCELNTSDPNRHESEEQSLLGVAQSKDENRDREEAAEQRLESDQVKTRTKSAASYTNFESRSVSPECSSELNFSREPILDGPPVPDRNLENIPQEEDGDPRDDFVRMRLPIDEGVSGGEQEPSELDFTFALPTTTVHKATENSFAPSGPVQPEQFNTPIKGRLQMGQSPSPRRAFRSASQAARDKSRPLLVAASSSSNVPMSAERRRKTPHALRQNLADELQHVLGERSRSQTAPGGLVPRLSTSPSPILLAGSSSNGGKSQSPSASSNSSLSSRIRRISSSHPLPVPQQQREFPIIEISSTDPRAAARAAAILKVHHKYIEEGWTAAVRARGEDGFIEEPNDIPNDWGNELDEEELGDLLKYAEAEVSSKLERSSSHVRLKNKGQSTSTRLQYRTVLPASDARARTSPAPAKSHESAESSTSTIVIDFEVWGKEEWRRLEDVYVSIRNSTDRSLAVHPERVIEAFLKQEAVKREECVDAWAWDTLLHRVTAIRARRTAARELKGGITSMRSTMSPMKSYDNSESVEEDEGGSVGVADESEEEEEGKEREILREEDAAEEDSVTSGASRSETFSQQESTPDLPASSDAPPPATPSRSLFSFIGSFVRKPTASPSMASSTTVPQRSREIHFTTLNKPSLYPSLQNRSATLPTYKCGHLRAPLSAPSPRHPKDLPTQKYEPASLLAPLSGPTMSGDLKDLPQPNYKLQRLLAPLPTRSPAVNKALVTERGNKRVASGSLVASLLTKLEKAEDSREEEQARIEELKRRGVLKRKAETHDLRAEWHVPPVNDQSKIGETQNAKKVDSMTEQNGKRRKVMFSDI